MKKIFDIEIIQNGDIIIPGTSEGDLLISFTKGGTFHGERLSGNVLPAGIWKSYTPFTGSNRIKTSLIMETYSNEKILMEIEAYLHLSEKLEERLIKGMKVGPKEYYYKGTAVFHTGTRSYRWLENRIFTFEGSIEDWSRLRFSVYEI